MKRNLLTALSVLMLLAFMLQMAPIALATPSVTGCPKSPNGNHNWGPRPRSAWCEWPGGIVYICSYCGKEAFEETTPALGHLWGEWTETEKATCLTKGSKTRTCSRCHKTETQITSAKGHNYGAWTVTTAPTCEQAGEQTRKCTRCGHKETEPVEPLGHDWDEGVVTKAPTATEDGVMTFTCKNDPSHTKTEPIPATGETVPKEDHPALYISLNWDGSFNSKTSGMDLMLYVDIEVTVTNTGNIPLQIKEPKSGSPILQPEETYTYTVSKNYLVVSSDSGGGDSRIPTPDDPLYSSYFVVTIQVAGYDPDGIIEEALCTSNEASLTIKFSRDSTPDDYHPALSLNKTASKPENGEYFKQGEPIHWSLSVTNTTEAPITDVTVTDKGATVGSFDSIGPEETQSCSVPDHIVTEYEAAVVGYVKNVAVANGKDQDGNEGSWPSNEATALTKKPLDDGEDPLGPIYDLDVGVSLVKDEVPGPANGEYYQLNETINYVITIKNTGKEELKDLVVTDSLAGFAAIGSLSSLAPGEEKTFNYSYTVQAGDIGHPWVVNSAILTYTFGDGISGTPRVSTVHSKVNGTNPPGFDPELLPRDSDYCSLTLNALGSSEARYTLHACTEHLPAAEAAEAAARDGDWDKAVEIWRGEIEKLYVILYEAGDSEAKSAVMAEKALFDTYIGKYADAVNTEDAARMREDTDRMYDMLLAAATGSRREALLREREQMYATIDAFSGTAKGAALAEALRLKCADLCCSIHTMPENRPDSLAGQHAALDDTDKYESNAREISDLEGSDSEVVERYDETGAQALIDTARIAAGTGNQAVAFRRGATLWQMALDDIMNPVYEAAAEERKQDIAAWRVTLDGLLPAERNLLAMMYGDNQAVTEEQLMNLYKDAVLNTEHVR